MWVIMAIVSGFFYTITALLNRKIFVAGKDPWVFSFFFTGIIALVSFPIVIFTYKAPAFSNFIPWIIIVASCVLVILHNYLNFTALKYLSASVHGTFYKVRLIWAFLLGMLFLGNSLSALTFAGITATIAAGAILLWKNDGKITTKGVVFVLASSLANALTLVIFKYLFGFFGVETLIFTTSTISTILIALLTPKLYEQLSLFVKTKMVTVVLTCLSAAAANYTLFYALNLGQVTGVLVMLEAFLILVLAGEHFVLKEQESVFRKLLAVILATVGAACILLV